MAGAWKTCGSTGDATTGICPTALVVVGVGCTRHRSGEGRRTLDPNARAISRHARHFDVEQRTILLPKTSASPGLPLGIRRYIVNLIAKAGSNSTWSEIRAGSTPKIRQTAARDRIPLSRTRSYGDRVHVFELRGWSSCQSCSST